MEVLQRKLRLQMVNANEHKRMTNEFQALKTDEERVKFTLNVMQKFNAIPTKKYVMKCSVESDKLRKEANKIYIHDTLNESIAIRLIKLYSKSIALAPYPSQCLALAYANRSAILLKIKCYNKCIKDIDRALGLEYPDVLKLKLYIRKCECLIALGDLCVEEAYEKVLYWSQDTLNIQDQNKVKKKFIEISKIIDRMTNQDNNDKKDDKLLPTVESKNPRIPCASDAVDIMYHSDYGRSIVATRDIQPGELIAVEKPYSLIILPDEIYTHCSHCLNISWANIPCKYCTSAMYCSEECQSIDWEKHHDIECSLFPILFESSEYKMVDLLSVRIALDAVKEAISIKELRAIVKKAGNNNNDGKFYSDKYSSIYSLVTHTEKRSLSDLFQRSVDACSILYFLATETTMFGKQLDNVSQLAENNDVTFIGSLILRHQQIIPVNLHSVTEEYQLNIVQYGAAALPFHSLINHSCDPNISRHWWPGHSVIMSIHIIKKGQQILDSYAQHYAAASREMRHKKLEQYYFKCTCIVCEEDWPLYFNLPSFNVYSLTPKDKKMIMTMLKPLDGYIILAESGDVLDKPYVLTDLLEMIKILDTLLPDKPCQERNNVIETLKRIYDISGNRFIEPNI